MPNSSDSSRVIIPAVIVGVAIILASWGMKSSLERTADQLDGIRLALADTKASLEKVASRPAAAAPAAAPARRRGPDPNRKYTVKTAGAPIKGPATAKVEIVEFSDFQ